MKNNHLGQELSMVNVLKRSFPGEDKVKQSEVHKKVEEISDRFYWQLPSQRQNIAFLYLCISKVVLSVYPSILLWILISSFFFFFSCLVLLKRKSGMFTSQWIVHIFMFVAMAIPCRFHWATFSKRSLFISILQCKLLVFLMAIILSSVPLPFSFLIYTPLSATSLQSYC